MHATEVVLYTASDILSALDMEYTTGRFKHWWDDSRWKQENIVFFDWGFSGKWGPTGFCLLIPCLIWKLLDTFAVDRAKIHHAGTKLGFYPTAYSRVSGPVHQYHHHKTKAFLTCKIKSNCQGDIYVTIHTFCDWLPPWSRQWLADATYSPSFIFFASQVLGVAVYS